MEFYWLFSISVYFSTVSIHDHFLRHPELYLIMNANLQKVSDFWQYVHTKIVKKYIYITYLLMVPQGSSAGRLWKKEQFRRLNLYETSEIYVSKLGSWGLFRGKSMQR